MGEGLIAAARGLAVTGGFVAGVRAPGGLLVALSGSPPLARDDPLEILLRSAGALLFSAALVRFGLLNLAPRGSTERGGIGTTAGAALALAQVGALYLGPFLHGALLEARRGRGFGQATRARLRQVRARAGDPRLWRDCIVAPVSEELCFRGCLPQLLQWDGAFGEASAGALAPVLFGLAHLPHVLRFRREEGLSWGTAFGRVAFMFAYTTAFGWYSAYLVWRTGGLAVPIMAHSLCNAIGVPDFSYLTLDSRRGVLRAATLAGIAGFAASLVLL